MATISEDYVSFETAKLLKEKGFDQNCATYYLDGQVWRHYHGEVIPKGKQIYAAPTQAMAMKWLREVHHLYIQVMLDSWALGGHTGYYVVIQNTTSDFEMMLQDALDDVFYNTYEEACEAAIKYCLENLI